MPFTCFSIRSWHLGPNPPLLGFVSVFGLILVSLTRTQAESYTFVTQAGWPSQDTTAAIDGTNSGARFFSPVGLALGPGNSFYIADGSAIRRISPSGTNWVVTTLAGMANMHASND